jgi:hypothetical protein
MSLKLWVIQGTDARADTQGDIMAWRLGLGSLGEVENQTRLDSIPSRDRAEPRGIVR